MFDWKDQHVYMWVRKCGIFFSLIFFLNLLDSYFRLCKFQFSKKEFFFQIVTTMLSYKKNISIISQI
jgi:hypothetical protein